MARSRDRLETILPVTLKSLEANKKSSFPLTLLGLVPNKANISLDNSNLPGSPADVINRLWITFFNYRVDRWGFLCYIIRMLNKIESIFTVTFTNDSTVFIKARDRGHARRIVERNGTQWLSSELTVDMIIKKIERSC